MESLNTKLRGLAVLSRDIPLNKDQIWTIPKKWHFIDVSAINLSNLFHRKYFLHCGRDNKVIKYAKLKHYVLNSKVALKSIQLVIKESHASKQLAQKLLLSNQSKRLVLSKKTKGSSRVSLKNPENI